MAFSTTFSTGAFTAAEAFFRGAAFLGAVVFVVFGAVGFLTTVAFVVVAFFAAVFTAVFFDAAVFALSLSILPLTTVAAVRFCEVSVTVPESMMRRNLPQDGSSLR